jgi:hypothetical protein
MQQSNKTRENMNAHYRKIAKNALKLSALAIAGLCIGAGTLHAQPVVGPNVPIRAPEVSNWLFGAFVLATLGVAALRGKYLQGKGNTRAH